jgi:dipeptidyl aminopeptidase/acylaminoacyl peptidase
MMRMRIGTVLLVAGSALLAPAFADVIRFGETEQPPLRVDALKFSTPTKVAELDMGKLKGEPSRLAWSPDGSQLYVQTLEGAFGQPSAKLRHYVFTVSDGTKKDLQAEPEWAAQYWTRKSGQASPDDGRLKIELKTERRQQRATSVPMGGDLARGAPTTAETGTSAGDAGAAAYGSQTAIAHVMQLKGTTIGEFINSVIVPGLTFGWGPTGSKAIAFAAEKSGRVVVMDEESGKREVAGSKDAILPAWSPNGARLAWLQKDGRRTFVLQVADVSMS